MTLDQTTNHLDLARGLDRPEREAMLRRDPSVAQFWADNRQLLVDAWADWEAAEGPSSSLLNSSLIDPALRTAVENAWEDPTTESAVADLLHESAAGVFSFQFFDPERLNDLRGYLEEVWDAGIPLRPPYGIVLNRRGAMLDLKSEGSLAAPAFQDFYRLVMDTYMRPIARLLFPEIVGYDTQTFGFSIHYQPSTDASIRPHTDASAVTLNINANLPGEEFTGSTVDFFDPSTGDTVPLTFEPGMAMIHAGNVAHTAQPITSGERTNLVLWLFGEGGRIPTQWAQAKTIGANERWTVPTTTPDTYAPF
jgi:hypothetical protein